MGGCVLWVCLSISAWISFVSMQRASQKVWYLVGQSPTLIWLRVAEVLICISSYWLLTVLNEYLLNKWWFFFSPLECHFQNLLGALPFSFFFDNLYLKVKLQNKNLLSKTLTVRQEGVKSLVKIKNILFSVFAINFQWVVKETFWGEELFAVIVLALKYDYKVMRLAFSSLSVVVLPRRVVLWM